MTSAPENASAKADPTGRRFSCSLEAGKASAHGRAARGTPRFIALLALLLLLGTTSVLAADTKPAPATTTSSWPQGWLFRVTAVATEKSDSYDVILDHQGLAQTDGRDIRVFSADGQPVSHFIAYADPVKTRILFDGSGGPGEYSIYFGNLDSTLKEEPEVAELGRKDWAPVGGFSVTSYAQVLPLSKRDILGHKMARANFEKAEAAAKAKADEQKDARGRAQFVRTKLLRDSNADMGNGFYHVFRAEVEIPTTGEWEIQLGAGASLELGMLYMDGNPEPIVEGSFKTPDAMMVIATQVKMNIAAGVHVFEMYTNRRYPDMLVRFTKAGGLLRHLDGLDAHYEKTARLTSGAIDAGATPLADAYLAAIRGWASNGKFERARALAQVAREKFPGDVEHEKLFSSEYERAGQTAYDDNWLTEGKYPSRSGAVANVSLHPPLRMSGTSGETWNWDVRHISSAVSVEGKIVYGLSFPIMFARPWGVTSAICVEDGILYVGAKNGVMHAITLSSGLEKWTFAGGGACLGPPLLYRGVIYYGGVDRRLYAVDAQRGRMLWNFPVGGFVEGGPAADQGRIVFGSRDGTIYCVDGAIGVERWHVKLGSGIFGTPCITAGRVFIGSRGGDFAGIDLLSGRVLWKYDAGAAIEGGACATDTRVYFGDGAGHVHALDTSTGKPVWNDPAEAGGPVIAAPILVGDILYGGTADGKLFGIDVQSGIRGWEASMPGNGTIGRPPIFANDTVTFTSRSRNPLAPDRKTLDYRGNTASFIAGPARNDLKFAPVIASAVPATSPTTAPSPLDEALAAAAPLPPLLKPNGLFEGEGPAEIRLAWEEKMLHLSATVSASDLVIAPDPQNLRAGSALTLLLDPQRNGSSVYEFSVAPDGSKFFTFHNAPGIDRNDPKTKSLWDKTEAQLKQLAWAPKWTADIRAEGEVRRADEKPTHAGQRLWQVEMNIPMNEFPKALGRVSPRGSWRINVIVTDSHTEASGKALLRTWALCPPTAGEPLGNPARWPLAEFAPVKK